MQYCDKLKQLKKEKEQERKVLLDELHKAKLAWDKPKIDLYDSRESLNHSHLCTINFMLKAMNDMCLKENLIDNSCDETACKVYYDYVLSVLRNSQIA